MNTHSAINPIDYPSALERTGGDREFLDELLTLYIEDFEDKYPRLKKAVETKDSELIRDLAHGLKGSSANLSLLPLQDLFFNLELAGRENNPTEAEKTFSSLIEEYRRLMAYIKNNGRDAV